MGIGDIAAGVAARAVYGDAEDIDIRERARSTASVVISSDTDLGTLLAFQRATSPSVLTREVSTRPTGGLVKLLLADLDTIAEALEKGAVVVLSRPEIRVRQLALR